MPRSPLFLSLLAASALSGAAFAQQAAKTAPAAVPVSRPGHPAYGTFGIDTPGMDRAAVPGDDFNQFVNGTWEKTTTIPNDKPNIGAFDVLQDMSRERTKGILEAAAKQPGSKIGDAYATYLDTATIEAKGLAPIKPWLARIATLSDKAGYPALAAEADVNGVAGPFGAGVSQDSKDPEQYALRMGQAGLGLPDRDYYLDAKLAAKKQAYQDHIAKMFTLAGEANAEARAAALVAFETQIAEVSWDRIKNRNSDLTYNKLSVAELGRSAPGFDFAAYFKGMGTPVDTVIVGQPDAVAKIAALIGAAPLQVLKDQLLLRSLDGYASVLPKAFDDERFHMYATVIADVPEQQARWKRAVDYTGSILTDEVSKPYVARYFPPATKAAMDTLVAGVIAAMNVRIDKLDWMTPETKVKAHAKLAAFTPRIGYPSQWRDYSSLNIVRGDAFGNELRSNQFAHQYNIGKLGKPIYRWEWGMTPMTVNAQANPTLVAITFPAAILQPPFFDPNADPAVNYGAIGAVIGHEMSHHFDDQGSKYDVQGRLAKWWTDADVAAFKARTDKLVAQYDAYEPLPGYHVKGGLTLGENTADIAGLLASLDAYHASLGGKPAPVIAGTTGDQRFFMGYAQVWRRKHREGDLRNRLLTDPHAPAAQRVMTVRNMDAWYDAYKVAPAQKMYLSPEERVRIW
ncbi:M13 family metallopeptidase [Sphingomonas aracearum]|uniref:M13 family peptidase n=1 Tax=Sphingomonas aracearum TaxID=2283317 RepID=A0A369VXY0_9SPHN|nr:M13 family metallopeptidase [Sphingomonas aracearum]RDE06485.1 M13 family peptidase [Sphingomonas aracearum]